MAQRICRSCRAPLEEDQETCPSCHTHNPIPKPWYVPFVGGAIVLLLVWLLVDFGDVARVLGLE
jgi:hypothetical protein